MADGLLHHARLVRPRRRHQVEARLGPVHVGEYRFYMVEVVEGHYWGLVMGRQQSRDIASQVDLHVKLSRALQNTLGELKYSFH